MGNFWSTDAGEEGKADLNKVETSGASEETAKQDNLQKRGVREGVRASEILAETDQERVEQYKIIIKRAADKHGVDPALIAAIMSRECRAGNTLDEDGFGDNRKAYGLMQIDVTKKGGNHKVDKKRGWNTYHHINQATGILVGFIEEISETFSEWSKEQKLKGGIAAYNAGVNGVLGYKNVDENTTGRDYSNDVVARAQWFKRHLSF